MNFLYYCIHASLLVMSAEACARYYFWWEAERSIHPSPQDNNILKYVVLGVSALSLLVALWSGTSIVLGLEHRGADEFIGIVIDSAFLASFVLILAPIWGIRYKLNAARMTACALSRFAFGSVVPITILLFKHHL
jgi:hypothetical protein